MEDLIASARNNDVETLHRLIDVEKCQHEQQLDTLNQSTKTMQKACHEAARHNHPEALMVLLDAGCWVDPGTITAACEGDSKSVFDALISRGWNINGTLGHIGDALILAVGADKLDMVQFLLSRGADPNANLSGGINSALELAGCVSSIPVIDALLDAGAVLSGRSALCKAAEYGRTDIVAHILERGADIDETPDNPDILEFDRKLGVKNALCTAAWKGHVDILTILLEKGADVTIKDTRGRSALELAQLEGHGACVGALKGGTESRSDE